MSEDKEPSQNEKIEIIRLPIMGEGVEQATVSKQLKKLGDSVTKGEAVCSVATDKVDNEILSETDGFILALPFAENQEVKVHEPLAIVGPAFVEGFDASPYLKSEKPAASSDKKSKPNDRNDDRGAPRRPEKRSFALSPEGQSELKSSPLARKMAQAFNLNLFAVAGNGVQGRIHADDVMQFIDTVKPIVLDQNQLESLTGPKLTGLKKDGDTELLDGVPVRRQAMDPVRKKTAKHMSESVRTSPHVSTTYEICLEGLVQLRKQIGPSFQKKHEFKLSFTHLFSYLTVQILKKYPILNCSVDGNDILMKDDINLGVAVGMGEAGLYVPVVHQAHRLGFTDLSRAIQDQIEKTRTKKIELKDLRGGTFTITNPGIFGCFHSNAIINQPQVAILVIGGMYEKLVMVSNQVLSQPFCQIGLTFDHRVIDGETGAKFLADLRYAMENISLDKI